MQAFNLIIFTGFLLSICVIISLSYKVYTLKTLLKQLILDQRILKAFSETLKDQLDLIKNETDETQEHFIKFLSEIYSVNRKNLRFSIQIFSDMSKKKALNY